MAKEPARAGAATAKAGHCRACGLRMNPVLVEAGWTIHPCCEDGNDDPFWTPGTRWNPEGSTLEPEPHFRGVQDVKLPEGKDAIL